MMFNESIGSTVVELIDDVGEGIVISRVVIPCIMKKDEEIIGNINRFNGLWIKITWRLEIFNCPSCFYYPTNSGERVIQYDGRSPAEGRRAERSIL